MDTNSSNEYTIHFICTNFGSPKDGIGHYTSLVVNKLKKHFSTINVCSSKTYDFPLYKLMLSMGVCKCLWRVLKICRTDKIKHRIILEYPFVDYNPLMILSLMVLYMCKGKKNKIILSLHEYSRTKSLRKLYIRTMVRFCNAILYTREEDIREFRKYNIDFLERPIPANIQPLTRKKSIHKKNNKICFFGIINYEVKEIKNMMLGWEAFCAQKTSSQLEFHFITSSLDKGIKQNELIKYHYNLNDEEVSALIHEMDFMVLPIYPRLSVNNGSLSVACIHECIPVGKFDKTYFRNTFGIDMNTYSVKSFVDVYTEIDLMTIDIIRNKAELAYEYGKTKSIVNTVEVYVKELHKQV